MNVGEFKKVLRGLKNATSIKIVTKGVRPYHQGGGEYVDIEYASPCYNLDKPGEIWLNLYTNPPTEINKIKEPRKNWAEQFKKAELEDEEQTAWVELSLKDAINGDLPFSACTGTDCEKREKCRRYLLFSNISDGNTCIVPHELKPCKSFMPIKNLDYYMSLPYKIVIYPASEGGYVAEIPDLPGCLTQGDNWQDTFDMIQDAKAVWIDTAMQDGRKIPVPNKS